MIPTELGTQDIGNLLRQFALPAIIAMTASSLYNMVDSIFIGQGVGPLAISGLAVTFPLMNLSTAVGTLVGVGAATLISMLLGQKNYQIANRVLGNVVILNTVLGAVFMAVALIFIDPILTFFGASPDTLPYAKEYMTIILWGNIITHIYFGLNGVLRASGHPKKAMQATILTVALNAILDPIFIFVLDLGIKGAAMATVIAQIVALIWVLRIFTNKDNLLHFSREVFRFDMKIASRSLSIGLAPFLMNIASCFVVILINKQLHYHGGDMAIGSYGIVNRIAFLFVMVNMGFTQGMQPIASYNFGAKQFDRVKEVLRKTIILTTITTSAGFLVGMLFPETVVSLFTKDPVLKDMSAHALRITMVSFVVVGSQITIGNFFQCIGMAKKAIFLSLSRQLLFLVPFLIIFPSLWETDGVWWSLPASDAVSAIVAYIMIIRQMRTFGKEDYKILD